MSHVSRLISLLSSPVGAPLTVLVLLSAVLLMAVLGRVPFRYNVRNLVTRWPTTVMTALAFTAVIGLWTGMQAFVNGMNRLTENSGHPENVILLSPGSNDEVFSNLAFTDMGDIENQPGVARDAQGRPLCSKETYIIVNQPLANPEPGRPKRRFLQLRGIEAPEISAAVRTAWSCIPGGQWFSQAGVRSLAATADPAAANRPVIEAVVGEGVARLLGRDRSPAELAQARDPRRLTVGDQFALGDRQWIVVGVMRSSGLTFDSEVWAKRGLVGPMFGKETYTSLVLRHRERGSGEAAEEVLRGPIREGGPAAAAGDGVLQRLVGHESSSSRLPSRS